MILRRLDKSSTRGILRFGNIVRINIRYILDRLFTKLENSNVRIRLTRCRKIGTLFTNLDQSNVRIRSRKRIKEIRSKTYAQCVM